MPKQPSIEGTVSKRLEPVRLAFIENFTPLGGACCIYERGEKVVDLWGGLRDRASGKPWREDMMAIVHSTTKGLAAIVMALAHSRGWLDYEERIAAYWPELAQNGKERITIRQLLAHQAGLFAFDEPVDRDVIADLDRLADVMARQRPAWEPGEQAYHAISLGFYEGELIRRVDPARRTLGRVFADALAAMNRRSVLHRSLIANPGTGFYLVPDRVVARNHEVSSAGGVSTARAIARAYGVFATGGAELGLRAETLEALKTPAIPARRGFFDECLRGPAKFSLGFMKPSESVRFGHDGAFGAPGAGGAMGYADPQLGIGYGYVTSRRGMHLEGDPRDVVLRNAIPAPGA